MKSQLEYLQDLSSPPNYRVPIVYSQDISNEDWAARSLYGIIVVGEINWESYPQQARRILFSRLYRI